MSLYITELKAWEVFYRGRLSHPRARKSWWLYTKVHREWARVCRRLRFAK